LTAADHLYWSACRNHRAYAKSYWRDAEALLLGGSRDPPFTLSTSGLMDNVPAAPKPSPSRFAATITSGQPVAAAEGSQRGKVADGVTARANRPSIRVAALEPAEHYGDAVSNQCRDSDDARNFGIWRCSSRAYRAARTKHHSSFFQDQVPPFTVAATPSGQEMLQCHRP